MKAKTWWILGFFLMALVVAGPALAAPVGKVTTLQGQADITNPAGKVRALKLGDPINNGDILRTKAKARVGITFTDGNTLWLAEKTRMKISRYSNTEGSSNVFDLFRGKSRSVVTKLTRGSRMEVHTPTAVCGVRGTTQISMFLNGQSSFFLQGGAGYGYNRNNPGGEVGIPAGHGMVVTDGTAQPVVQPSTAADIEKHMQDTSAGDGEGALGLSDAGTTLDPSAPWTPGTGEQTPPPTIPQESAVTFSTPVLLGDFSGTLGGNFDPVTGIGTVTFGGTGPAAAAVTPLETPLTGTLSNGATFTGLLGGVPGSYSGFFNSITNNGGTLGLLAGNLDGTFAGGAISASGPLTLTNLGYAAAGEFQAFNTVAVPTFATVKLTNLSYYAPVVDSIAYGYPTSTGGVFGLWGASSNGSEYDNPDHLPTWSAYYGYDFNYNDAESRPDDVFMLGLISGTDDGAGHTTITGNDSIQYMDRNYLGLMSVNYRGYYYDCDGACSYDTAGTGTFKLAPLAFSGDWGSSDIYFNSPGGYYGESGDHYGLVGGFSLPWLGSTTMYAMGGYSMNPSKPHYLWNTSLSGQARIGMNDYDPYRSFEGFTAGLWVPVPGGIGYLEGAARALFKNTTYDGYYYGGTIGILGSNSLSGNYYPTAAGEGSESGMWRAEGTLDPYYSESVSGAMTVGTSTSTFSGNLVGTFDAGGDISAKASGSWSAFRVDSIYTRPWGIYSLKFESFGVASNNPDTGVDQTFTTYVGGEGDVGYYGTPSGYWLATVKGTWKNTGEIRGWLGPISGDDSSFGIWMTKQYVGGIGGPFYGINESAPTYWIGESIGSYSGTPLAFASEGSGAFWEFFTGEGSEITNTGSLQGLFGGVNSLFGSGPTPYLPVFIAGIGMYTNTSLYSVLLGQFAADHDSFEYRASLGGVRSGAGTAGGLISGVYWNHLGGGSYGIGVLYSSNGSDLSPFGIDLFEQFSPVSQMWLLGSDAQIQAYQMSTVMLVEESPDWDDWLVVSKGDYDAPAEGLPTSYGITQQAHHSESIQINGETWSAGATVTGGGWEVPEGRDFTDFAGKTWTMTTPLPMEQGENYDRVDVTSVDGTGAFTAKVAGAQANFVQGWTSVHGGVAKGLFHPDNTWRAVIAGVGMETNAFLLKIGEMDYGARLAFQNATGIPSIQVGSASLSGSGNNLSINMNDVTFLSSQTGAAPQIWATNAIAGTYSGAPVINTAVALTGGGLTAAFTPKVWSDGIWGAAVTGAGALNGPGMYSGHIVFTGGAAGTFEVEGSSLTGTGAGVARPVPAP